MGDKSAEDPPFRRRRKTLKLRNLHTLVRYIATLKRNEFALHLAAREKAAKLTDEVILINQIFMLDDDAPVDKPYLITLLSKTKEAAMIVWSLHEHVKPIGFQEFFFMFDLKSTFKITQLDESDESTSSSRAIREDILANLLAIGEEFNRVPTSQSEMTRVEVKEKTLEDKVRKDSRGRSALAKSANLGHGSSSPQSSSSSSSLTVSKSKRQADERVDSFIPTKKAQVTRGGTNVGKVKSTGIAPIVFDEDDNPTINDMIAKVNDLVKRAEEPLTIATGIQNISPKFCPQCGQQVLYADANFCISCGRRLH
jgi:hypothetical protein